MIATLEDIRITIHRRTPGSGHLTAEMSLADAVKFADAELAQGRVVIVEMGEESTVVRVGREIVEFIKRLFGAGQKGRPTLTTLAPMAGGEVDRPESIPAPPIFPRRYSGELVGEAPERAGGRAGGRYAPPEADYRAWAALVERIGESAARGMLVGGGYAVRSTLWPYVLYVVTPEIIKVINQGVQVSRICIVATDGGSIWDAVLNRIQLLETGIQGEVQVYGTGVLQGP